MEPNPFATLTADQIYSIPRADNLTPLQREQIRARLEELGAISPTAPATAETYTPPYRVSPEFIRDFGGGPGAGAAAVISPTAPATAELNPTSPTASVEEWAAALGLDEEAVRSLLRSGLIPTAEGRGRQITEIASQTARGLFTLSNLSSSPIGPPEELSGEFIGPPEPPPPPPPPPPTDGELAREYMLERFYTLGDNEGTDPEMQAILDRLQSSKGDNLMRMGFALASGTSPYFSVNFGNAGNEMMDSRDEGYRAYTEALMMMNQINEQRRTNDLNEFGVRLDTYGTLFGGDGGAGLEDERRYETARGMFDRQHADILARYAAMEKDYPSADDPELAAQRQTAKSIEINAAIADFHEATRVYITPSTSNEDLDVRRATP